MSVVINYRFGTECSEDELKQKLERLRERAGKLDGVTPGAVQGVELALQVA